MGHQKQNIFRSLSLALVAVFSVVGCAPYEAARTEGASARIRDAAFLVGPQSSSPTGRTPNTALAPTQAQPTMTQTSSETLVAVYRGWSKYRSNHIISLQDTRLLGGTPEGIAFKLFKDGQGKRTQLFSCFTGDTSGSYFVSNDLGCEGRQRLETLGYVEPEQIQGRSMELLVRCFHPLRGHLIVTNRQVGDCIDNGYKLETALGWIPVNTSALSRITSLPVFRGYSAAKGNHYYSTVDERSEFISKGYNVEEKVFGLFAYSEQRRQALYLCLAPSYAAGSYFFSDDMGCEGQTYVRFMGYSERTKTSADLIELYRCAGPRGHLVVAGSTAECTSNGYTVESSLGFVQR